MLIKYYFKLKSIIDKNRKANGKHNYLKIAKVLGYKNHSSAKKLIEDFGLLKY